MFFVCHCIEQVLRFVTWYPCQQSAQQLNCNFNPCLSITMSKRFFDCSLTAADAPKISFVPQKWCRSSRACIAAPDVLTMMCQRRQSSPNFEMALGIQRQSWKQLRGVCRADRQVMLWPTYKRITTTYNDVQTWHKSTTIVTQKYNNRTNGKWGGARATNKSKPHWSTCFLLNTLESGK